MNTTAAAAHAGVTVATIRAWCRRSVIAATKRAGRWVIEAASLARRIALGGKAVTDSKPDREQLKQQAEQTRARILAELALPELAGTPKQIAWAEEIRGRRLDAGFKVVPHMSGRLRYQITDEALGTVYLKEIDYKPVYDDEAEAVRVLTAAVTSGQRATAKWWIDNRTKSHPF